MVWNEEVLMKKLLMKTSSGQETCWNSSQLLQEDYYQKYSMFQKSVYVLNSTIRCSKYIFCTPLPVSQAACWEGERKGLHLIVAFHLATT